MKDLCNLVNKDEQHVPGGQMRACVMAALHFDFDLARSLGSYSDTKKKYNEENTNILHLVNLLDQLSKLYKQEAQSTGYQEQQILQKV